MNTRGIVTGVEHVRRIPVVRRRGPETDHPGDRSRIDPKRRATAYVLAVVLPIGTAAAMIPLRVDHGRVAVLVLVIPVVVVARFGASGPAIVAAASAVLGYDLFLVEPHYELAITDPDEVIAAVTLFGVALVVGVLSARLARMNARDSGRRNELQHMIAFARMVTDVRDEQRLTIEACEHISSVLNLRKCTWEEGLGDATAPMLLADGNLMARTTDLNPDRATLPDHLDIPVWIDDAPLGRFVAVPTSGHVASYEERLTAATIATLYGRSIAGPRRVRSARP